MIELQRGQPIELDEDVEIPLHWYLAKELEGWPEWIICLCTCSHGHLATLSTQKHSISAEGVVSPSYVCPYKGCDFHDYVRLIDWQQHA